MNKATNWIVAAAVVEMALVALGAMFWKWEIVGGFGAVEGADQRRMVVQAVKLLLYPTCVAVGWLLARRRLASTRLVYSTEHVRLFEISLVIAALLLVVLHGLTARSFIADRTLDRETVLRAFTAFVGVLTLVQGNFIAKVAAPTGAAAPDRQTWPRLMLRVGWGMTVIGLAVVACALTLPARLLLPTMLAAVAALVVNSVWQRRRTATSTHG